MGIKVWSGLSNLCRPRGTIAAIISHKRKALENEEESGCAKIKKIKKKYGISDDEDYDPDWNESTENQSKAEVKKRTEKKTPNQAKRGSKPFPHLGSKDSKNSNNSTLNDSTNSRFCTRLNFVCCFEECPARFMRSDELERHIKREHHHQPIYYCNSPGCAFRSGSRVRLFEHEVSVPSWHFTFKCPISWCSFSCPSAKALTQHQEQDHDKNDSLEDGSSNDSNF